MFKISVIKSDVALRNSKQKILRNDLHRVKQTQANKPDVKTFLFTTTVLFPEIKTRTTQTQDNTYLQCVL